jgi:hypothetical protein
MTLYTDTSGNLAHDMRPTMVDSMADTMARGPTIIAMNKTVAINVPRMAERASRRIDSTISIRLWTCLGDGLFRSIRYIASIAAARRMRIGIHQAHDAQREMT